jgi:hypothetical protein
MNLDSLKTLAEAIQALVTAIGLVAAGLWTYLLFVRRRQRFPRADFHHEVTIVDLTPHHTLIHVCIVLKNVGDVLIRAILAQVHVGRVLPLHGDVDSKLREGEDIVAPQDSDARWATLGQRECSWQEDPCEVEPGETEEFHFDVIVSSSIEVIEVCSYLKNEAKRKRNIGWRHTSFVWLERARRQQQKDAKGESRDGHEEGIPS